MSLALNFYEREFKYILNMGINKQHIFTINSFTCSHTRETQWHVQESNIHKIIC